MAAYTGPSKIVVVGGGLAGLAAMDALTEAFERFPGPLPADLEVTLVEPDLHVGGRAGSRPLDAEAHTQNPAAPWGTNTPHGLHFVWGSYDHLLRLTRGAGPALSPPVGTSTYCAWLAPPDLPGDDDAPARVVAVHVCDPARPDSAWNPRARRILTAFSRRGAATKAFERIVKVVFDADVDVDALLSYMDIVFDEENLGRELRWILFVFGALSGMLGDADHSRVLKDLLKGRAPTDVDIGEMTQPLFEGLVLPKLRRIASFGPLVALQKAVDGGFDAAAAVLAMLQGPLGGLPLVGEALAAVSHTRDDLEAFADFMLLLARDSVQIVERALTYDPRRSGYLKNILKAAFSSPFGLDVATSMRDAQFGVRRYKGSVLQVFDGDDPRALWEAVVARIEARFAGGKVKGSIVRGQVAKRIVVSGGKVTEVDLAAAPTRRPPEIPTVRPAPSGPTTSTLPADAVVSSLLPQCLVPLLDGAPGAASFVGTLRHLSRFMNETVNLQLLFPERLALPFSDPPSSSTETRPFGISNLEGLFTIVVDLERGWSAPRFEEIRLDETDATPFRGTAWELVGAYADMFTHDRFAHPGRYQWSLAAQQLIAAHLHDPNDFDPSTVDTRPWVHDADAPNRMPPPVMGEVMPSRESQYLDQWKVAAPLIVAHTVLQLAALPGLDEATRSVLETRAGELLRGEPTTLRWVLTRNAQAENRFFSAEPGLYSMRPHARFQTPIPGLWAAGDWTRNGLNLQAMEAAVISGLQSAYGIIEQMRGGGLVGLTPPFIDPDIMPRDAWDVGV